MRHRVVLAMFWAWSAVAFVGCDCGGTNASNPGPSTATEETVEAASEVVETPPVPAPDADEDGVPDSCDHCPDASEPFNGVADGDGCGDFAAWPAALPFLWFEPEGSTASSEEPLDAWAAALEAHPHLIARLLAARSGDSDDVLRARTQAAFDGLVRRGIDAARLRAEGEGYIAEMQGSDEEVARFTAAAPVPPIVSVDFDRESFDVDTEVAGCDPPAPDPEWGSLCATVIGPDVECARITEVVADEERQAFVIEGSLPGDDNTLVLVVAPTNGEPSGARIGRRPWMTNSSTALSFDTLRFDQVFEGGASEVVVEWRGRSRFSETSEGYMAATTVTKHEAVCVVEPELVCRSVRTLQQDNETLESSAGLEWKRSREALTVDWLPDGRVRIEADGDAGEAAEMIGEHTWPDVPN